MESVNYFCKETLLEPLTLGEYQREVKGKVKEKIAMNIMGEEEGRNIVFLIFFNE